MEITYEVVYRAYHYNDGTGRHGEWDEKREFDNLLDAEILRTKIDRFLGDDHEGEEYYDFRDNYVYGPGYFVSPARIFKVTREQLP